MIEVRPESVDPPPAGSSRWVLVVMADEMKRRSVRKAWESAGFAVEVASSATDALECLKVMTPSLVVIEDRLFRREPR